MNMFNRIIGTLALCSLLALGACSGEADVDMDADTAGVDLDGDTAGMNDGADLAPDTSAGMMNDGDTAVAVDGEGIEKLVEAKLIASPGFSGVEVESEGEGVIILKGKVASDEEKTRAESEAKSVSGVMTVRNELTVGT